MDYLRRRVREDLAALRVSFVDYSPEISADGITGSPNPGAIAGGVVGGLLGLLAILLAIFLYRRRQRNQQRKDAEAALVSGRRHSGSPSTAGMPNEKGSCVCSLSTGNVDAD